jgi:hypothetical protein
MIPVRQRRRSPGATDVVDPLRSTIVSTVSCIRAALAAIVIATGVLSAGASYAASLDLVTTAEPIRANVENGPTQPGPNGQPGPKPRADLPDLEVTYLGITSTTDEYIHYMFRIRNKGSAVANDFRFYQTCKYKNVKPLPDGGSQITHGHDGGTVNPGGSFDVYFSCKQNPAVVTTAAQLNAILTTSELFTSNNWASSDGVWQ